MGVCRGTGMDNGRNDSQVVNLRDLFMGLGPILSALVFLASEQLRRCPALPP